MSMRCEEIREKISMMVDNELSDDDRALVTEHLAACPDCMQVYEAFAAVSACLNDLEEPPEGFTDAVMEKVRLQNRKPRLRRQVLRFAGLAACLAVLLYAGNASGMFRMGSAADSASVNAAAFTAAEDSMESSEDPAEDAEEVYAALMEYGSATLYFDDQQEKASLNSLDTDRQPPETDTASGTDASTAPVSALEDLLAVGTPAEYGLYDGAPDYTVSFSDDTGSGSYLLIWVDGTALYCQDPATETAYYAVGTADDLLAVFTE